MLLTGVVHQTISFWKSPLAFSDWKKGMNW